MKSLFSFLFFSFSIFEFWLLMNSIIYFLSVLAGSILKLNWFSAQSIDFDFDFVLLGIQSKKITMNRWNKMKWKGEENEKKKVNFIQFINYYRNFLWNFDWSIFAKRWFDTLASLWNVNSFIPFAKWGHFHLDGIGTHFFFLSSALCLCSRFVFFVFLILNSLMLNRYGFCSFFALCAVCLQLFISIELPFRRGWTEKWI